MVPVRDKASSHPQFKHIERKNKRGPRENPQAPFHILFVKTVELSLAWHHSSMPLVLNPS
jgi:hypothetical protein